MLIIVAFVLNMRNRRKGLTLCLAFLFVVYLVSSYPGEVIFAGTLEDDYKPLQGDELAAGCMKDIGYMNAVNTCSVLKDLGYRRINWLPVPFT